MITLPQPPRGNTVPNTTLCDQHVSLQTAEASKQHATALHPKALTQHTPTSHPQHFNCHFGGCAASGAKKKLFHAGCRAPSTPRVQAQQAARTWLCQLAAHLQVLHDEPQGTRPRQAAGRDAEACHRAKLPLLSWRHHSRRVHAGGTEQVTLQATAHTHTSGTGGPSRKGIT